MKKLLWVAAYLGFGLLFVLATLVILHNFITLISEGDMVISVRQLMQLTLFSVFMLFGVGTAKEELEKRY